MKYLDEKTHNYYLQLGGLLGRGQGLEHDARPDARHTLQDLLSQLSRHDDHTIGRQVSCAWAVGYPPLPGRLWAIQGERHSGHP